MPQNYRSLMESSVGAYASSGSIKSKIVSSFHNLEWPLHTSINDTRCFIII